MTVDVLLLRQGTGTADHLTLLRLLFLIKCEKSNMKPGDGLDNDCDGGFDEEVHDGKDNDGDGEIDEDLQLVILVTDLNTAQ